jgi:catechol 2,3-dioxygenase-like lactoylglutathione lyase family enzyme
MAILRLDHVQVAIPPGADDVARRFYGAVLGLAEIPKPAALTARGGAWFALGDTQLHLGVDPDFRPAKKAHVALQVDDLDKVAARCQTAGHEPRPDDRISGRRRFFVDDPFGNRIEIIAALPA